MAEIHVMTIVICSMATDNLLHFLLLILLEILFTPNSTDNYVRGSTCAFRKMDIERVGEDSPEMPSSISIYVVR